MTLTLLRAAPLGPPAPPDVVVPRRQVAVLASGRGGVGTSTTAALLAAAAAEAGWRTLLVDGVPRVGTLHILFGRQEGASVAALRAGHDPEQALVAVTPSLWLLPALGDEPTLGEADRRVLQARLATTYARFDLVVVDAGASASAILDATAPTGGATRVLVVAAGDRTGLAATYAVIKLVHQRAPHVPVALLTTRVDDGMAELLHRHVEDATRHFLDRRIPLATTIPDDGDFEAALAAGLDAHDAAAGSRAAASLRPLLDQLLADPSSAATAPRLSHRSR